MHCTRPSPSITRRAALEKWKESNGSDATYNNLIIVFERAGYRAYANTVKFLWGEHRFLTTGKNGLAKKSVHHYTADKQNIGSRGKISTCSHETSSHVSQDFASGGEMSSVSDHSIAPNWPAKLNGANPEDETFFTPPTSPSHEYEDEVLHYNIMLTIQLCI